MRKLRWPNSGLSWVLTVLNLAEISSICSIQFSLAFMRSLRYVNSVLQGIHMPASKYMLSISETNGYGFIGIDLEPLFEAPGVKGLHCYQHTEQQQDFVPVGEVNGSCLHRPRDIGIEIPSVYIGNQRRILRITLVPTKTPVGP